ncbi:HAD family phosphatase [Streptomyces sp. AM 4-1-1]|uniref:HAD family hydrolase n=1 Tax=Streptomyces sp. AM 4-1-1 TaxID=3028710 RepID=UPI0023B9EF7A|nr:HAD family phosphatase [Streptomyces sp. AM 4-1-1]WEH37240.1 HAD family phosphatase [Streptomyces sp. AM 4-1-1]
MSGRATNPLTVAAALFDLDGTLINSEPRSRELWKRLFAAHGVPSTAELLASFGGRRSRDVIAEQLHRFGPELTAEDLRRYLRGLDEQSGLPEVVLMRGARTLLDMLRDEGIPTALVTSGSRTYATDHLTRLGIADYFTTLVTADDIIHGKPNPEGYLLACRRLEVSPRDALVFEDSEAGFQAAQASGARYIAVGSTPAAGAQAVVADLADTPAIRRGGGGVGGVTAQNA